MLWGSEADSVAATVAAANEAFVHVPPGAPLCATLGQGFQRERVNVTVDDEAFR